MTCNHRSNGHKLIEEQVHLSMKTKNIESDVQITMVPKYGYVAIKPVEFQWSYSTAI